MLVAAAGADYDDPEEDMYEMVDTTCMKGNKEDTTPQRQGSVRYANISMNPAQKQVKALSRTDSEKYSNGYMVPCVSKTA